LSNGIASTKLIASYVHSCDTV
ncbi:hypothetical protein A2U01_0055584, partial [Trifolium medium]|nr:hypothetical protein [Trifolium medium]